VDAPAILWGVSSTRPVLPASDVDRYVAGLDRALRGPRRAKRSLLAEARDGLDDAAEAYERAGLKADDARRRAIADFGDVDEVAPSYQVELGAAQSRRTGWAIVAVIGLQIVAWDHAWPMFPEPSPASAGATIGAVDSAVESLGSVCLLLAVGLIVAARFGARRQRVGVAVARSTALLGWVVGAHLTASAVVLNVLDPAARQTPIVVLLVPLALFIVLPVAGLIRSSRHCLALSRPA
jgi:hypothetical protein